MMKTVGQNRATDGAGLVRPEVRALRAYQLAQPAAGRAAGTTVRLHQNEAPEDWPEAIKREIVERLVAAAWHRYPSARADEVCRAIADMQGTPAAMIAATAGSNEALWAACAAFAARGTVVLPAPTYSMSRTLAIAAGARVVEVPLARDFALDAQRTWSTPRDGTRRSMTTTGTLWARSRRSGSTELLAGTSSTPSTWRWISMRR